MGADTLNDLLHELARRHGHGARVTVVVRHPRLPGGVTIYTGDDLREVVATIERKAGPWVRSTADGERERRLREALQQALERLEAVERSALSAGQHELSECGATLALLREQLRET